MTLDTSKDILAKAYSYAFPLVLMDATCRAAVDVDAAPPTAPSTPSASFVSIASSDASGSGATLLNKLIHSNSLATANSKLIVTPNVDTVYTQAWIDLSAGPLALHLPSVDRFFTIQLLDAWTNTAALLDEGGDYVLMRAGWDGKLPESLADARRIELPTDLVWGLARIVLNGSDDMPAVRAIQDQMNLQPVGSARPKPLARRSIEAPVDEVLGMDLIAFFELANELMVANPPADEDDRIISELATIGVGPDRTFDPDSTGRDANERAQTERELKASMRPTLVAVGARFMRKTGIWEYYGDPIGDFGTEYDYRALIALGGLGANTTEVAIYPRTSTDADGEALDGSRRYQLHFESLPPVEPRGFWSVTVYGDDDFLVDNPIDRYCINDRSDTTLNADGSLDIALAATCPSDVPQQNWLPTGDVGYHLFMRIYLPDVAALDSWTPPTIERC